MAEALNPRSSQSTPRRSGRATSTRASGGRASRGTTPRSLSRGTTPRRLDEDGLREALESTKHRLGESEQKITELLRDNQVLAKKIEKLKQSRGRQDGRMDAEIRMRIEAKQKGYHLQTKLDRMQMAVQARLRLLGIDLSQCTDISEALDAALSAISKLSAELTKKENEVAQLEEENAALQEELGARDARINKGRGAVQRHKDMIEELKRQLAERDADLEKLQNRGDTLEDSRTNLEADVDSLRQRLRNKERMANAQFDELMDRITELEDEANAHSAENEKNQATIRNLNRKVAEAEEAIAQKDAEIERMGNRLADLEAANAQKDAELERAAARIRELEAELNREKIDKAVQTEISGPIDRQLTDYPRLLKQIVALKNELTLREAHIGNLTEENRQLLADIDELINKAARFYPDLGNHTGEVTCFAASPTRYMAVTGSADRTIRMWRLRPQPEEGEKKAATYACSRIDAQVLGLAFSRDGNWLCAGTSYKDGPDGYVLLWHMEPEQEGTVEMNFRSLPTQRFGQIHCLCFSDDNRFIFGGDTTGTVWVLDTRVRHVIARAQPSTQVIQSLSSVGPNTFAAAYDQTLSRIEIQSLGAIADRYREGRPVDELPTQQLDRNGRYPYWVVDVTEDGTQIVCGSRKVHVFNFDGTAVTPGTRITDSDMDHVRAVKVKYGRVITARQATPRAKMFELATGREIKVRKFKRPCTRIDFMCDDFHAVCCIQELFPDQGPTPPQLAIWRYLD